MENELVCRELWIGVRASSGGITMLNIPDNTFRHSLYDMESNLPTVIDFSFSITEPNDRQASTSSTDSGTETHIILSYLLAMGDGYL
jgi:hypothetical protein